MSILKIFLTNECIQNNINSTDKYVEIFLENPHIQAKMNSSQNSNFFLWKPTNFDETWLYVTVTLLMSTVNKPQYHMC